MYSLSSLYLLAARVSYMQFSLNGTWACLSTGQETGNSIADSYTIHVEGKRSLEAPSVVGSKRKQSVLLETIV